MDDAPAAADSWDDALAKLTGAAEAGEPYPVLLLDASLPGPTAGEQLAKFRSTPALARTAVVLLASGGDVEAVSCRGQTLPAVHKPVRPSRLLEAVRLAADPTRRGGSAETPPAHPPAPAARSLRLLLAEDNVVNQKLAVRLLEKQGHAVTVAGNGRVALEALEAREFDAAFFDVQMPEMDGLEAVAELRRREAGTGRHLPVIALTAHAMKGDQERCLAAGMDVYLTKPIRIEEIRQALAALLPTLHEREPQAPSSFPSNP